MNEMRCTNAPGLVESSRGSVSSETCAKLQPRSMTLVMRVARADGYLE